MLFRSPPCLPIRIIEVEPSVNISGGEGHIVQVRATEYVHTCIVLDFAIHVSGCMQCTYVDVRVHCTWTAVHYVLHKANKTQGTQ